MLGVFALAVTFVKGWAFARWKPSLIVQFVVDQSIFLAFLFLVIAALYNATRVAVKVKPTGPSSVASTQFSSPGYDLKSSLVGIRIATR